MFPHKMYLSKCVPDKRSPKVYEVGEKLLFFDTFCKPVFRANKLEASALGGYWCLGWLNGRCLRRFDGRCLRRFDGRCLGRLRCKPSIFDIELKLMMWSTKHSWRENVQYSGSCATHKTQSIRWLPRLPSQDWTDPSHPEPRVRPESRRRKNVELADKKRKLRLGRRKHVPHWQGRQR
jgi:hypothetical protein